MFNKYFDTKKKRVIIVVILFINIVLFSFLYYKLFNNFNIRIPCIFRKITGLFCPGCGITRAIFSVMELNFLKAFKYNLLLFTIIPILGIYFGIKIYYWINFNDCTKTIFSDKLWYLLLLFTIIFGILRNFELFSFLAP